jgi:hypothetical protein
MDEFQQMVRGAPRPMTQEEKDARASNPLLNLENAFIDIDGKRYRIPDLMRLLVEKLQPGQP